MIPLWLEADIQEAVMATVSIFIELMMTHSFICFFYVDDMLIATKNISDIDELKKQLKKEFEMKDLRKIKFCFALQIEHLADEIPIHQSTYTKKVLKRFYMDKAHSLSTLMVVRSLDVKKDPFRPHEDNKELLGPEVPYLSAIGVLMYLTNNT